MTVTPQENLSLLVRPVTSQAFLKNRALSEQNNLAQHLQHPLCALLTSPTTRGGRHGYSSQI